MKKDWSGMFSGYYKKRWELFFNELRKTIKTGEEPDMKAFNKIRARFDWEWTSNTQSEQRYAAKPAGNPIKVCENVYKKWALYL
jgi:alpha-N-acetylglucosaminidase